jgi:hypothetical protein
MIRMIFLKTIISTLGIAQTIIVVYSLDIRSDHVYNAVQIFHGTSFAI